MPHNNQHQGMNPPEDSPRRAELANNSVQRHSNHVDHDETSENARGSAHHRQSDVSSANPNVSKQKDHHRSPQKYPTTWQAMQSAKQEIPDEDLVDIQDFVTAVSGPSEENSVIPLIEIDDINDPESILRIGRWGEELVSTVLQRRGRLPSGQLIAGVNWVNQSGETGKPYDIEVELEHIAGAGEDETDSKVYIEVKSTSASTKDVVDFSWKELKFAEEQGKGYHLYRVYSAGRATHKLRQLENLSCYLHNGPVRLLLLL